MNFQIAPPFLTIIDWLLLLILDIQQIITYEEHLQ